MVVIKSKLPTLMEQMTCPSNRSNTKRIYMPTYTTKKYLEPLEQAVCFLQILPIKTIEIALREVEEQRIECIPHLDQLWE
jgi:hypothetical protein